MICALAFASVPNYLHILVGLMVTFASFVMLCVAVEAPKLVTDRIERSKVGEALFTFRGRYVVDYDEDKKAVRFVDEIGRAVTAAYDGRGRTTAYTYPEGDQEVMAYDDRNNQTLMRKVGKPGTGEAGQQLNIGVSGFGHTVQIGITAPLFSGGSQRQSPGYFSEIGAG